MNVEVAHTLHERGVEEAEAAEQARKDRHERVLEILEAVLLAIVAIATAWSGYQAAKWDGENARLYGQASKLRAEANQAWTLGGQQRLFDSTNFSAWLEATTEGKTQLAHLFVRRFSPEYRVAFVAWVRAGGLTNPNAPPGPSFMPQYHNHLWQRAAAQERQATATFAAGTEARHQGDDVVRNTVLFATVLFLIAVGQRFKLPVARRALLGISLALLVVALAFAATFPLAP
jgi:hypothetical protein